MRHVSRDDLAGRLEPFLIARLAPGQGRFACRRFRPALIWSRLDLAIKLLYLKDAETARDLYDAHIAAFSLGDMKEPGSDKHGAAAFRRQFEDLHRRIRDEGFDADQSLIPLARGGSILNGAHRGACAMQAGKPVVGVETGLDPVIYDYRYFRRRGMSDEDLDAAVLAYVDLAPQARIALLSPMTRRAERALLARLGPLVYRRVIRLTPAPNLPADAALLLLVVDAGGTVPDAALWVSASHDEARAMARLLLVPPQGARPGASRRLLYRWRRGTSRLRHQAIALLGRMGMKENVRRLYRRGR